MKAYRLKLIPVGLYYKPGNSNLSKRGKVYLTGKNGLGYKETCISLPKDPCYNYLKEAIPILKELYKYKEEDALYFYIPNENFIKEIVIL